MSILDALVCDGPYRGWPLAASIAISQGQLSPSEVKAKIISSCEAEKARLDQVIEMTQALPDVIELS